MTEQQLEQRVRRLRRAYGLAAIARELRVPFARVQEVVDRLEARPVEVHAGARGRTCGCGAPAVDVLRGAPRCLAFLCPEPTAEARAAEWHYYATRGEGNLARHCADERGLRAQEGTLLDLRHALDRALVRCGAGPQPRLGI